MGIHVSKQFKDDFDETCVSEFCGRENEIKEIVEHVTSKHTKTVCIHGPKFIGKSRVIQKVLIKLEEIIENYMVLYLDFSDLLPENTLNTNDFTKFLTSLCNALELHINDSFTPCSKCDLCTKNVGCSTVLLRFRTEFIQLRKDCLICFDNADKVLTSTYKKEFLDFLNIITQKRKNTKILVTSTVRFHMTSKALKIYSIHQMQNEDLKKLLFQQGTSLDKRDPWIDAVVSLCDGIPRCAETLGSILNDDDGLIEPKDLVECLLTNYLKTLSPELFPAEDKPADVYLREIGAFEKMSETYQQKWLYDVADTMEGSEVLPKEALDTVRKKGTQVSEGAFKMDGLRKWLDYSLLQKETTKSEALSMQRLYKHLLSVASRVINLNGGGDLKLGSYEGKEALQLVKEEGQRIGLDLTNLENVNALKIEILLNHKDQRIKRDESGRSSGEENEDDSGNSSFGDECNMLQLEDSTQFDDKVSDATVAAIDTEIDSISGPYALSYKQLEDTPNSVYENKFKTARVEPFTLEHSLQACDRIDDIKGQTNCRQTDSETEDSYFRGAEKDNFGKVTGLSNSYPAAELRKKNHLVESSDASPERDRSQSVHQLYISPQHRLNSEDYEKDIKNNCVHTVEARDSGELDSPNKRESQTYVRYSNSSTDSGELKLGFQITVDEK